MFKFEVKREVRGIPQIHSILKKDIISVLTSSFCFQMSSVDENITHCLEQIDSTFVKAIDVVASISKSVKSISSNMREMEMHSRVRMEIHSQR